MTTDPILKNARDAQLGPAVEENVFAMFRSMTQVLNGDIEENPNLSRYHAAPSSPIFKGAYRRKGIGSAMQLERLRSARELGYQNAVLFGSEMGYSPYLKLGFKDTGRRVSRYLWRNV